jgi:MATE family multidrug resistance protein
MTNSIRETLGELLKLALPLMVGNLFFTLQISIDRVFLSWHDDIAPGAAFAAAMLFYAPVILLVNTAGFTATFVAQYRGAGQPERIGGVINQALWFCLVTGVLFAALATISPAIIDIVGHRPELQDLESRYLFCLCFCALPMAVNSAVSGFLAGLNRPWLVLGINGVGLAVNALLDWLWIFGNGGFAEYGIEGAGWATVAGSFASMAFALAIVWRPGFNRDFHTRSDWRPNVALLRRFLSFAFPNGVQATFEVLAWMVFTLLVGKLGPAELSATNLVMMVNSFFFVPMMGLGQAVCVFVGQRMGAGKPDEAARGVWVGFAFAGPLMTALGVVAALMPGVFLAIFRSSEPGPVWNDVVELAPTLLWFVAVYSFFDSMNVVFAFALRGAGDTRYVSVMTLVCGVLLLALPCWYVTTHDWGVFWAWSCATLYIAGQGVVFLARFSQGQWRSLRVIEPSVTEEPLQA